MACNSYNHPPDCNCGWGGQWHGNIPQGRGGPQEKTSQELMLFYKDFWNSARRCNYESYLNPNARCPVCGNPVYFYQSQYGGRVFFDEIGPPWPKHPCTESVRQVYVPLSYFSADTHKRQKISWQAEGWEPVSVLDVVTVNGLTTIEICRVDTDGIKLNLSAEFPEILRKEVLCFIRETNDLGIFEVSYLDILSDILNIRDCTVTAFRNCYLSSNYLSWKNALTGSAPEQNLVARDLLFCNSHGYEDSIDLEDFKIDLVAAKYWLEKSSNAGYQAAKNNLVSIDLVLLKNKLEGNCSFDIKDFEL